MLAVNQYPNNAASQKIVQPFESEKLQAKCNLFIWNQIRRLLRWSLVYSYLKSPDSLLDDSHFSCSDVDVD